MQVQTFCCTLEHEGLQLTGAAPNACPRLVLHYCHPLPRTDSVTGAVCLCIDKISDLLLFPGSEVLWTNVSVA